MGRLSKEQRRRKRKAKERQHQKRREEVRKVRVEPWVAPKMKLFKLPPLLNEDVPREKRLELLRALGKEARKNFDVLYPQTAKWLTEYDPVYVLSMCAFYLFAYPEGVDPEATGQLEFHHHYLELLQAFALCQARNLTVTPLFDEMSALKKHMEEVGQHISMRHFDIPERLTTERELSAYQLRTEMMVQTTGIRNWAYPHQMRKILLDLAAAIAPGFEAMHGVNPVSFFAMLLKIPEEVEKRLNTHMGKMRQCVAAEDYARSSPRTM